MRTSEKKSKGVCEVGVPSPVPPQFQALCPVQGLLSSRLFLSQGVWQGPGSVDSGRWPQGRFKLALGDSAFPGDVALGTLALFFTGLHPSTVQLFQAFYIREDKHAGEPASAG